MKASLTQENTKEGRVGEIKRKFIRFASQKHILSETIDDQKPKFSEYNSINKRRSSERSQSIDSDLNVSAILPQVEEMLDEALESGYFQLQKDILKKSPANQSLTKVYSLGDLPNLLS